MICRSLFYTRPERDNSYAHVLLITADVATVRMSTNYYQPEVTRLEPSSRHPGCRISCQRVGDADAPLLFLLAWMGRCRRDISVRRRRSCSMTGMSLRPTGAASAARLRCACYWFPDYLADLHELLEHLFSGSAGPAASATVWAATSALYAGTMPERVAAFVNVEGFGLAESRPGRCTGRLSRWIEAADRRLFSSTLTGRLVESHRKRNPRMPRHDGAVRGSAMGAGEADGSAPARGSAHKLPNPILYRRAEAEACWRSYYRGRACW